MDKVRLTSSAFWDDETSIVLSNERAGDCIEISQKILNSLPAHIFFQTSGSSGIPKWVAISKGALLESAKAVNSHLNLDEGDSWFAALPVYHVGGIGMYARAYLSGARITEYIGQWNPESFTEQLNVSEASWVSLVPTQLVDLVRSQCSAPDSLRGVIIGGGALDRNIEKEAIGLAWPIHKSYGMTEAGSQLATQTEAGGGLRKLPHVEFRSGEDGLLEWKGGSMFSAYVINNEIVSPDEWFATKDIVELDGDELRFLKRSDKMVKILGELVDLDGLENELNLESEEQVVLIDIPNERRGREIVPVLEHEPSSKRKELLSSLNGLHLLREPVIKKFPRSDLGKIMRAKLREQIVE